MDACKFSTTFDVYRLREDLSVCLLEEWNPHFNRNDFTGTWASLSLRSISGAASDIRSVANAAYQNTPILQRCPYFREIIDWFECPKEAVRLLSLTPKSFILEHKDQSTSYRDGFFRIHIPIETNESVIFRVNGEHLTMLPGACWYANFNLPHFVSNDGNTDRIHLVIDCIRNEWSDQLFGNAGYDFENEKVADHDRVTKLAMIEHLTAMNTDTADQIIARLKSELDQETGV